MEDLFEVAMLIVIIGGGAAMWFYIIAIATSPVWITILIIHNLWSNKNGNQSTK